MAVDSEHAAVPTAIAVPRGALAHAEPVFQPRELGPESTIWSQWREQLLAAIVFVEAWKRCQKSAQRLVDPGLERLDLTVEKCLVPALGDERATADLTAAARAGGDLLLPH